MARDPVDWQGDAKLLLKFVSDDYLLAIGRVITQWSLMETTLDATIWQTARLRNDLGRSVTSQMQVLGKLDLCETLLSQTRPALAEQFRGVANYVRSCLQGPRNTTAHGMWSTPIPESGLSIVSKFSAKGKLTSQGGIKTVGELEVLALQIAEVTHWLMRLSQLLPKLKQRPGGLGHNIPEPQNPQNFANLRTRVFQPPTRRRKVLPKPKPQKRPKRPKGA